MIFFPFLRQAESVWQLSFTHYCAGCGIFPHTRSHLTNPRAVAGVAGVRARSLRLRSGQALPSAWKAALVGV